MNVQVEGLIQQVIEVKSEEMELKLEAKGEMITMKLMVMDEVAPVK